jgi:predicted DCC family thiol-disulfide oxidoreductase YuxK
LPIERPDENRPIRGWVLYDDACGFCQRWIPFWAGTLRKQRFAIAPLQTSWVRRALGVGDEDLLNDLRLLLADGRQIRGADVYRHVMSFIWWAYPFYLFSISPVFRRVFDWGYRTFNANRYHISRTCRLEVNPRADAGPADRPE